LETLFEEVIVLFWYGNRERVIQQKYVLICYLLLLLTKQKMNFLRVLHEVFVGVLSTEQTSATTTSATTTTATALKRNIEICFSGNFGSAFKHA